MIISEKELKFYIKKAILKCRLNIINEQIEELNPEQSNIEPGVIFDEHDLKEMLHSYLETAMWTHPEEENGENEMDDLTIYDIDEDSRIKAWEDIKSFVEKAGSLLDGVNPEAIGHNFWLDRNGHGTGFKDVNFDNDDEFDKGDKLSKIAQAFGGDDLYVGDDGGVYLYYA